MRCAAERPCDARNPPALNQSLIGTVQRFEGWLVDHLQLTDTDWNLAKWAMEQVHGGEWGPPWVVTYECGGAGRLYRAVAEHEMLAAQVPRLRA